MLFALKPDWEFQMLIQMIAKSELGEALIICGLEKKLTSLKICDFLSTSLTSWKVIGLLVFSEKYRRLKILRYNFDYGNQKLLIKSLFIFLLFLIVFLIVLMF